MFDRANRGIVAPDAHRSHVDSDQRDASETVQKSFSSGTYSPGRTEGEMASVT